MSRDTVCRSWDSLMSNRKNPIPSTCASCFASSVLPTPVGPVNRNEPIGFSGARSPARASLIALASCYFGLSVRGGAPGVGRAVNASVVASASGIFVLDYFVTYVMR